MTRLDEFDKIEWGDVARSLRPDWTDEQFEDAWADFQAAKAKHLAERSPQWSKRHDHQ